MKKIHFKIYNLKNILVNSMIVMLLAIISLVAFYGEDLTMPASTINGAHYRGNAEKQAVSLMFNVYWGSEYLEGILKVLNENEVNATFFIGGMWLVENENLVKEIHTQGHEIANHGYKHKDQDKLSYEQAQQEILSTHNLVKTLLGVEMNLFAPPSGAFNSQTIDIASSLGYSTVMWSKDTIDWRDQDAGLIEKRASGSSSSGELILMHPTKATLEALPKIIKNLQAENLKILPVGELISA